MCNFADDTTWYVCDSNLKSVGIRDAGALFWS